MQRLPAWWEWGGNHDNNDDGEEKEDELQGVMRFGGQLEEMRLYRYRALRAGIPTQEQRLKANAEFKHLMREWIRKGVFERQAVASLLLSKQERAAAAAASSSSLRLLAG